MENPASGARRRGSFRRSLGRVVVNFLMILFSVSCLYPVVWLCYASLNDKRDFTVNPVALPKAPSLANYFAIFSQSDMGIWMLNTLRNTAVSLPFILLFGFIIGYLLSRFHFRGHTALYGYFLLGIVIPIHALMIPLYVQFKKCHILNRWFTLPVAYIAFGMPIVIFLVESYVHSIPVEMEEAATLDGSSFSRTMFSIILPMCRPLKNETNIKKRMKEFKAMLERNEVLNEFDRFVFESIVEKVIVGEIDEDDNVDPYKLTFVYKTGFNDNQDGSKFKTPRKNESMKNKRDAEESNKLCSHTNNEVNKLYSYSIHAIIENV